MRALALLLVALAAALSAAPRAPAAGGASVEVTVVDPAGHDLGDVRVDCAPGDGASDSWRTAWSRGGGAFTLAEIGLGPWRVVAQRPFQGDRGEAIVTVTAADEEAGRALAITIALVPAPDVRDVRCAVVDAAGRPVPGSCPAVVALLLQLLQSDDCATCSSTATTAATAASGPTPPPLPDRRARRKACPGDHLERHPSHLPPAPGTMAPPMVRADDPTGSVVPTPQPSAATVVASPAPRGPDDPTHRSPPPAGALSPLDGAPQRIGPYRITEVIGRGGMGVVYAAVDTRLDRRVALKVIAGGAGGELTARFEREARSMARLGKHPHIVQVHEVDRSEGRDYLVMDLVLGPTLAEVLRSGPLSVTRAAEIGEKVARALDHAHRHGLIHRDVKPSNVLLGPEGEPQVSDFGLVKDAQSEERLSATGAILGTPSYMAPEQAERPGAVDARADVYGAGALLYHAMTGRPPFEGGSWAATIALVLSDSPTPPAQVRPQISRDAQAVIEKAMERDPGARYQSAQLLADDLGRLARGEPVQARPRSWLRRALSGTRKRPLRAAIAMALLLAAGGAAALAPGWLAASRRERAERLREAASSRAGFEERAAALGEALALDPSSWRAYADRARLRVEEIEERERTNERFAARYDSTALAREALADCDRALALRPDAAPVLLERAELEERLGQDEAAARDHEAYAGLDPAAASAYVARGRRRWERGDRKGALAHMDRAARLAPESVEPYLYRGPMLAETGKIDAAIADYDRAIALAPRMAKLRYGRAHLVQFYRRDMKGALAGFSEAIDLDPVDANNWFARGNLRRLVRPPDLDGAIADYRKALELSSTLNGPATNLGILLSMRGRQAEARAAFTEAIRRDPAFGMNYYGRAMTWLEGKVQDPDEARMDLDRACEREAKEPLPFWRRGALREDAGDLEGALADYEVARARIPEGNPQRGRLEETIAEVRGRVEARAKARTAPEATTPTARGGTGDF